jgi:hypothetical protein
MDGHDAQHAGDGSPRIREFLYVSKSPVMVKERELDYARSFPTNLTREAIAQQI